MSSLKFYQKNIIHYDLINKFNYTNKKKLPRLKKIILSFKNNSFKIKSFATVLFIMENITIKKCTFAVSRKPNIFLKIHKGQPVGGKVILKKMVMYKFLSLLVSEIFPNQKNSVIFKSNNQKNFSTKLNNKNSILSNLKKQHNLFNLINFVNITIVTNSESKLELFFLLKSFQFNIKYNEKKIYV